MAPHTGRVGWEEALAQRAAIRRAIRLAGHTRRVGRARPCELHLYNRALAKRLYRNALARAG